LPPAADLHELHAVAIHVIVLTQFVERSSDGRLGRFGIEGRQFL
jgi:hypothetical protein